MMHAQSGALYVRSVCRLSSRVAEVFLFILSALSHMPAVPTDSLPLQCVPSTLSVALSLCQCVPRNSLPLLLPVLCEYVVKAQLEPLLAGTTRLIRTVRVARRLRATLHGAPRARLATRRGVRLVTASSSSASAALAGRPPLALLLVLLITAVGARSAALRAPAAAAPTPAPPTTSSSSLLLLHPLLLTRLHLHALPAARLLRVLAVITSTLLHADADRNAHRRRMAHTSWMLRIIRRRPLRRRRRLHVRLLLRRDSWIPLAIRPIVAVRPLHRLLRHHRLRLLARLIITPVTAVCRVLAASCMVSLLTGPSTRA